jgi:hypothetical protein
VDQLEDPRCREPLLQDREVTEGAGPPADHALSRPVIRMVSGTIPSRAQFCHHHVEPVHSGHKLIDDLVTLRCRARQPARVARPSHRLYLVTVGFEQDGHRSADQIVIIDDVIINWSAHARGGC